MKEFGIQCPVYFPRVQSTAELNLQPPPPPAFVPTIMWRGAERGWVHHPTLADQQQQSLQQAQHQQHQHQHQQHQQQQPQLQPQQQQQWGPSPHAMHALDLYRACLAAGQNARFVVEQRPEGEYFSLTSRPPPTAAATTAAAAGKRRPGRKPNKKRAEKQHTRRESRRSTTAAWPHQQHLGKGPASSLQ